MSRLVSWLLVGLIGAIPSAAAQPPQQPQPANAAVVAQQEEDFAYLLPDAVEGVTVALPAEVCQTYRLPAQMTVQVAKTTGLLTLPLVTVGKPAVVHGGKRVDLIDANGTVNADALSGERVTLRIPVYDLEGTPDTRKAVATAVAAALDKATRVEVAKPTGNALTLELYVGQGGKPVATTRIALMANNLEQTATLTVDDADAVRRLRETEASDLRVVIRGVFKSRVGIEPLRVSVGSVNSALKSIANRATTDPAPKGPVLCFGQGGDQKQRLAVGTVFQRSLKILVEERDGHPLDRALLDVLLGEVMGKITEQTTATDLESSHLTVLLSNGVALTGGLADIKKAASTLLKDSEKNGEKLREAAEATKFGVSTSFSYLGIGGSLAGDHAKSTASKNLDAEAVKELEQIANTVEGSLPSLFVKLKSDAAGAMMSGAVLSAEAVHRKCRIDSREYASELGFGWIVSDALRAEADRVRKAADEATQTAAAHERAEKDKKEREQREAAEKDKKERDARTITEVEVTATLPRAETKYHDGRVVVTQDSDDKKTHSHFIVRVYDGKVLVGETKFGEGQAWNEGDTFTLKVPVKAEVLKNSRTTGRLEVQYVSHGEETICSFSLAAWAKDGKKYGRVVCPPSKPELWRNGKKLTVCEFQY